MNSDIPDWVTTGVAAVIGWLVGLWHKSVQFARGEGIRQAQVGEKLAVLDTARGDHEERLRRLEREMVTKDDLSQTEQRLLAHLDDRLQRVDRKAEETAQKIDAVHRRLDELKVPSGR